MQVIDSLEEVSCGPSGLVKIDPTTLLRIGKIEQVHTKRLIYDAMMITAGNLDLKIVARSSHTVASIIAGATRSQMLEDVKLPASGFRSSSYLESFEVIFAASPSMILTSYFRCWCFIRTDTLAKCHPDQVATVASTN